MNTETLHSKTKKQLVPQLRFDKFEGDWRPQLMQDLTTRISDGIHSTPKYDEEGKYYFVNGNNLKNSKIEIFENTKKVSTEEYEKHKRELNSNTILLSINGTIGNLAFYNNEKVLLGKSACYINLKPYVHKNLIYSLLETAKVQNYFTSELTGSTIKNLSLKTVKETKLFLPTNEKEQQKIASFLTSVDTKIQKLTKKKELLQAYKKGMIQQLFTQKLRFKREDGSDYPDWEEKKLKDVLFEHKTKNSNGEVKEVFSVAKEKGVVNQIEHLGRSYAADSTMHYKVAFPGDIIYTKSPTKDFPFGIIKQNLTDRKGLVSPLYVVTKPQTDSLGFMLHCYFLSWVNVYNYLVPLVQKGAKNTMNINNDDFLNGEKFLLPVSESEQQKIADYLSGLDTKIEGVRQQIENTQQFKKGLLQQMFV